MPGRRDGWFRRGRLTRNASAKGLRAPLDGGSCLNQRTITVACEVFSPLAGSDRTAAPLTVSELLESLWFLELVIVSRYVAYDGTLPPGDLSLLNAMLDRLSASSSVPRSCFKELRPGNDDDSLEIIQASAQQAVATFGDLEPQGDLDRPLPQPDAARFFAELDRVGRRFASLAPEEQNAPVVHEVALSYQQQRFRGSKSIAGIASLGPRGVALVEGLARRPGVDLALLAGTLINRFRFFYVRNLSFGAQSVYVPAHRWRGLSERQALTFQEFVRQHLERGVRSAGTGSGLAEAVREASFLQDVALPPLGLYALMTTRERHAPEAVARSAQEVFSDYGKAFRKFWEVTREAPTPQGGWGQLLDIRATGEPLLDRHHETIMRVFRDRFGELQQAAHGTQPDGRSLLRRFLVPMIVGAAVSAASAQLDAGLNEMLSAAVGAATAGGEQVVTSKIGEVLQGHVDQYRELDRVLLRDPGTTSVMASIEQQVQNVLGRRLVPG